MGEMFFFEFMGSGDGIVFYFDVFVDFGIVVVIFLGWWFWCWGKFIVLKVVDVVCVFLCYYLVLIMFLYGFVKVFLL